MAVAARSAREDEIESTGRAKVDVEIVFRQAQLSSDTLARRELCVSEGRDKDDDPGKLRDGDLQAGAIPAPDGMNQRPACALRATCAAIVDHSAPVPQRGPSTVAPRVRLTREKIGR